MCLAVPTKLITIEGDLARGQIGDVTLDVRLHLIEEAQVGDYVLVHAGFAITRLEEDEAIETLQLMQEARRFG